MSWTTYGKNAVCSYEIKHPPYILFVDDYSHYLMYLQVKSRGRESLQTEQQVNREDRIQEQLQVLQRAQAELRRTEGRNGHRHGSLRRRNNTSYVSTSHSKNAPAGSRGHLPAMVTV